MPAQIGVVLFNTKILFSATGSNQSSVPQNFERFAIGRVEQIYSGCTLVAVNDSCLFDIKDAAIVSNPAITTSETQIYYSVDVSAIHFKEIAL